MVRTILRSSRPDKHSEVMALPVLRHLAVLCCAAMLAGPVSPALAQSNSEQKPADQQKPDAGRDAAKRISEQLAEAGRVLGNAPAANPECVWIGERVVNLLSRDDLDTAFRHLELYDRFGCPGAHVQVAFRCLIRQAIDPNASATLNERVHNCWLNPVPAPAPTATAPATSGAPAPAAPSGTGAR